jgi:type IV pilus assembly protein PilM
MFGLFDLKKNNFTGIDFGTSAIKIVELSYKNQKAHLSNYGWVDLGLPIEGAEKEIRLLSFDDKLKIYLQKIVERMKLKSDSVYVAMPGFTGLITLLEFPEMKPAELEKAIQFEAHKYIPTSLNDVALGWEIIAKKDDSNVLVKKGTPGKIQVLLVAAPKKEVARYESIVRNTRLKIKALELETFSLARALVGDDLGVFLIIDIGARATNVILVEKGVVKVNRSIDIGGNEITSTIADSMNISRQRAEILKKENRDLLNSKESSIIMPTLEFVVNESMRIISAYKEKNKDGRIDGIIISGGSARLKGVDEYFTKMLNVQAVIGKPWKRITVDEKLAPIIEKIGTSYSVALGLALRGIEEYKRS